jgi:hypothetical protein
VVGAARSTAAAQHDAGGSLAHEREELARRGRFVELRLDRDGTRRSSQLRCAAPSWAGMFSKTPLLLTVRGEGWRRRRYGE